MKWWALYILLVCEVILSAPIRMVQPVSYKGQIVFATLFSNIRGQANFSSDDAGEYYLFSGRIDWERHHRYTFRRGVSDEEKAAFEPYFFEYESLMEYDEVLVLHYGGFPIPGDPAPMTMGHILGVIATNRLGRSSLTYDFMGAKGVGDRWWTDPEDEWFVFEKRLKERGIRIPRPIPKPLKGQLPDTINPHWDPVVAEKYFQPENVMVGDVVALNCLFADKDVFPILFLLANHHGLFSTGRVISTGEVTKFYGKKEEELRGPKVFIPTRFVWEIFNKMKGGVRREGSRTRHYRGLGAVPLWLLQAGRWVNEWDDPLMDNLLVQIASIHGEQVRVDLVKRFLKEAGIESAKDLLLGPHFYSWREAPAWAIVAEDFGPDGKLFHPIIETPCVRAILAKAS